MLLSKKWLAGPNAFSAQNPDSVLDLCHWPILESKIRLSLGGEPREASLARRGHRDILSSFFSCTHLSLGPVTPFRRVGPDAVSVYAKAQRSLARVSWIASAIEGEAAKNQLLMVFCF